jgi:hypothetical protein
VYLQLSQNINLNANAMGKLFHSNTNQTKVVMAILKQSSKQK